MAAQNKDFGTSSPTDFSRSLVLLVAQAKQQCLNPFGPKGDQHEFSPDNISRSSRVKGYENYYINDQRENALILKQILSTILKRNVSRAVWRICMWIFGLILLRHIGNYLYFSTGIWITNETFVSSF